VSTLWARIEIIEDRRPHRVVLPTLSEARVVIEKVLLTGRPGCGKTTLTKRVVNNLPQRAGGFYTEEIRGGGTRAGFKIVTLDGEELVFAHVDLKTPEHIGKYRLDLSALETVGVEAVREAVRRRQLVVIDEIGPMEIRSAIFRDAVNKALDSEVPVLATIFARSLPFTDAIKSRPDVTLIEVRPDNRERLISELSDRFKC
jgi:nucleoside-triphosphatase